MSIRKQKVLLFDLGRVLFDFDHRIATRKIKARFAVDEEKLYSLFFDSNLTDKFERGVISSQEFFREVKGISKLPLRYADFVPIWNEIFTPKPEMVELTTLLASRYPLYIVSNINELHYRYLHDNFGSCFEPFRKIFLSYELGVRKPDAKIYRMIIDTLGVAPADIIYTDDRPELVEAAVRMGIDGIIFTGHDALEEALLERGVISESTISKQ